MCFKAITALGISCIVFDSLLPELRSVQPVGSPKTEYKLVNLDKGSGIDRLAFQLEKLRADLKKLGDDGWELVSTASFFQAGQDAADFLHEPQFYFMRPVRADGRTRWEYSILELGEFRLQRRSPAETPDARSRMLDRLSRESVEGWQLAAAFYVDKWMDKSNPYRTFVLKRPAK
jgi:hypothetical protein